MTDQSQKPPPMKPGSPASASPKPMRPGDYVKKRREAAELEIATLAVEIAGPDLPAQDACRALFALEADALADGASRQHVVLIQSLAQAMPFDTDVYWTLVAARVNPDVIVPPICRACGCTEWDPCTDGFGYCAWAEIGEGEEPICTVCAEKAPDPAVGAPVPEEVRHAA